MMKLRTIAILAGTSLLGVAQAEMLYGATAGGLFTFDSATPGSQTTVGSWSGLNSGHTVRGMDFRPSNGGLYVMSSNGSEGQLYRANIGTGALTAIGTTFTLGNTSTRISLDFNPVVDRLRVVTGGGFNYRINPDTGAVLTDTNVAYAAGDVNFGDAPLLSGVAYTNNFAGTTSTTAYAYDYATDSLVTLGGLNQSPSPNGGQLFTVGQSFALLTSAASQGFDISGSTGIGYLQTDIGNSAEDFLHTINLSTGQVTQLGSLGADVLDISVAPVPEPGTLAALGLGLAALRRRKSAK